MLLGQLNSLQFCALVLIPEHVAPPCFGVGLVQPLNVLWLPVPQLLEQMPHASQSVHPPSTK